MLVLFASALSRRAFLSGAAAATLTISLPDWLAAQDQQPRPKRSEVGTESGKAMLALYSKAVAEMNDPAKWPLYHPFNWTFQANIHDYPESTKVEKIFDQKQGKNNQEKKAIADYRSIALGGPGQPRVWRTCSHFGYTEHFLTWHRMYLYFFERTVEKVVGKPFALPYWTYAKNNDGRRLLPPEFQHPKIGTKPNPLYFRERNEDFVNDGLNTAEEASHRSAFAERTLLSSHSRSGFSSQLEDTPHGSIHSAVGTTLGMGSFAMAARDPIFWVHHANIDRLWESWRNPGPDGNSAHDAVAGSPLEGKWKQRAKFAFAAPAADGTAGAAQRVEMSVADAMRAGKTLGAQYDDLEPVPTAMAFAGDTEEAKPATTLSKAASPTVPKITEKNAPVTVTLSPAVSTSVALGFAGQADARYSLVIEAEAPAPPGASYEVYLRVLKTAGGTETTDKLIKTFNFFSSPAHDTGHHAPQSTWEADITDLVRDKLVDPRSPGTLTFRARYATPKAPVSIKYYRIEAR
jgi:tyrosinase